MAYGNKTIPINCRFLSADDFVELHQTFIEAFSDYSVPFQMSEEQFHNHIALNGVNLDRSVGVFHGDRMIGFSLNGFGEWLGRRTVYDAGTAVLPDSRRIGAARAAFEFMFPLFRDDGWQQMLLEVISTNEPAIELYEGLGFQKTRRLVFYELKSRFENDVTTSVTTRGIGEPDWDKLNALGDGRVSWQNSTPSMKRTNRRVVIGAYDGDSVVGYIVVFPLSGIISQIAVDKDHRGRGVATALVKAADEIVDESKTLRFSNVDDRMADANDFLKRLGFIDSFAQIEMIKTL